MMMTDRKLYDLCRKYRYFYRKYSTLKEVNDEFHDKNIRSAYVDAKNELEEIHKEIIAEVLYPYLNNVEIEVDAPYDDRWFNPFINRRCDYTTTIKDKGFADMVNEVLLRKKHYSIKKIKGV